MIVLICIHVYACILHVVCLHEHVLYVCMCSFMCVCMLLYCDTCISLTASNYFVCITTPHKHIISYILLSSIFGAELIIAIMVVTGFAFIPAGFVLFLVQERASKAKHLQFVSGLSPMVYWVSNILWDMVRYFIDISFQSYFQLQSDLPVDVL